MADVTYCPDPIECDAAKRRVEAQRIALLLCKEYFDQRADCEHNGISYVPNEEMDILVEINEALS